MAEQAGHSEAGLVDDIGMIILCPICMDLVTDSRILSCGHTLCSACLTALRNSTVQPRVLCPVCRAPILNNGALTHNLLADQLAERLRSEVQPQPIVVPVLLMGPDVDSKGPGAIEVPKVLRRFLAYLLYAAIIIVMLVKLSEVYEGLQSDESVYSSPFTRVIRWMFVSEPEIEEERGLVPFLRRHLVAEPKREPGSVEKIVDAFADYLRGSPKDD